MFAHLGDLYHRPERCTSKITYNIHGLSTIRSKLISLSLNYTDYLVHFGPISEEGEHLKGEKGIAEDIYINIYDSNLRFLSSSASH